MLISFFKADAIIASGISKAGKLCCPRAVSHLLVPQPVEPNKQTPFFVVKTTQIRKPTSVRAKRCSKVQHQSLKCPGLRGWRRKWVTDATRRRLSGSSSTALAWLLSREFSPVHSSKGGPLLQREERCACGLGVSADWRRTMRIHWVECPR